MRWMVLVGCVVYCAMHHALCWAYDFEVSARTEAQGYQLRRYSTSGLTVLNRRRVTQYLGLKLLRLWPVEPAEATAKRSAAEPPLLWFHGQMRFYADFGDYVRPETPVIELEDRRFELLTGTLEGRNLLGRFDLSLGRQYDAELMDVIAFDGLRVRMHLPWHIYAESSVGSYVQRGSPLAAAVFALDGTTLAADHARAVVYSVAAGVQAAAWGDVHLALRSIRSYAAPLALAATRLPARWATDQQLLFARLVLRPPWTGALLDATLRYNLLVAAFDELALGLTQQWGTGQALTVEALRSQPHFDGDSIFNVFALEAYQELGLRYVLRLWADRLEVDTRGSYRWFSEDPLHAAPRGAWTIENTIAGRFERMRCAWSSYLLDGLWGRRFGADVSAQWASLPGLFGRRLGVDGRISLVRQQNEPSLREGITMLGLQAGMKATLVPGVTVHLMVEDNVSRLYQAALRVMAVLELELAP